jgi:hypothetical protein
VLKKWTKHLRIHYNFYHQISLSKSKCWYSNNCLHLLKQAVPLLNSTWCVPVAQGQKTRLITVRSRVWIAQINVKVNYPNSSRHFQMLSLNSQNEGKSVARFCHQVVSWVPDMFCNFYLSKSHKIAITQQSLKLEKK